MAKNINLLDRAPTPVISALNWVLAPVEDPTGLDRPLWRDYSRYQGFADLSVAMANGVFGYAARAGISWGYQDPLFPHFWEQGGLLQSMYRTSYHVIYPDQPVLSQADNWYRVHPERDVLPRVIDLELHRNQPAGRIAEAVWEMSEIVKSRDGVRPWIYSRYLLINSWLSSWTDTMLNDHYYWLAQFLWDRVREHPGPPTLPARVNRDNIVMHQTADKKRGFPAEVESYSVDWDRWELGDVSYMHQWISEQYGGAPPPPPTFEPYQAWVTVDLNMREKADLASSDIGTFAQGSDLKVISETEYWAEYPSGFVYKQYISKTPPIETPDEEPEPSTGSWKQVIVTREDRNANAHYRTLNEDSGRYIMEIYPTEVSEAGERVQWKKGEVLDVYEKKLRPTQVDGGGTGWWQVAEHEYLEQTGGQEVEGGLWLPNEWVKKLSTG